MLAEWKKSTAGPPWRWASTCLTWQISKKSAKVILFQSLVPRDQSHVYFFSHDKVLPPIIKIVSHLNLILIFPVVSVTLKKKLKLGGFQRIILKLLSSTSFTKPRTLKPLLRLLILICWDSPMSKDQESEV